MTQRTDTVWLEPRFTRCTPQGGSMDDFTRHWPLFPGGWCAHFMAITRKPADAPEPRVHPPVRGLS